MSAQREAPDVVAEAVERAESRDRDDATPVESVGVVDVNVGAVVACDEHLSTRRPINCVAQRSDRLLLRAADRLRTRKLIPIQVCVNPRSSDRNVRRWPLLSMETNFPLIPAIDRYIDLHLDRVLLLLLFFLNCSVLRCMLLCYCVLKVASECLFWQSDIVLLLCLSFLFVIWQINCSLSLSLLPAPELHVAAAYWLSMDGTDEQTDGRTDISPMHRRLPLEATCVSNRRRVQFTTIACIIG